MSSIKIAYTKGSELWDTLPRSTTACDTLFDFKQHLKKRYAIFLDV